MWFDHDAEEAAQFYTSISKNSKIIDTAHYGTGGAAKSLEAADYALSIASKERAQLIILNVLDTQPWFYGQSAYRWATEDVLRKVYAHEILEREKILTKIKEKNEKINIQSKTEVLMLLKLLVLLQL